MSPLETVALVLAALWLGALTFAVLSSVRQLAMLTAWAQERSNVGQEGLDAGTELPEEVAGLLPEVSDRFGYVLFLASDCQPCRDFAFEAGRSEEVDAIRDSVPVVAAVVGKGATADEVARLLPDWIRVVRDPDASVIRAGFQVGATPAVYEVERGSVTGHAVAGYGVVNFMNLVHARERSNASAFAGEEKSELAVTNVAGSNGGGGR